MADKKGKGKLEVDEESIPINKEDLPYEGDRLLAMRARDSNAIRLISRWINKYGKHTIIRVEEKELPESSRECTNEEDYISGERWSSENVPDFTIKIMKVDGTFSSTFCYKKVDVISLARRAINQLAAWVLPGNNWKFDDNGYAVNMLKEEEGYLPVGEPSIIETFIQLPVRILILKRSLVNAVNSNEREFVAIPVYETRIGNMDGGYQESRQHGQLPKQTVYVLASLREFNLDNKRVFIKIGKEIECIKHSRNVTPENSIQDIGGLRNMYGLDYISNADIQYYWYSNFLEDSIPECLEPLQRDFTRDIIPSPMTSPAASTSASSNNDYPLTPQHFPVTQTTSSNLNEQNTPYTPTSPTTPSNMYTSPTQATSPINAPSALTGTPITSTNFGSGRVSNVRRRLIFDEDIPSSSSRPSNIPQTLSALRRRLFFDEDVPSSSSQPPQPPENEEFDDNDDTIVDEEYDEYGPIQPDDLDLYIEDDPGDDSMED